MEAEQKFSSAAEAKAARCHSRRHRTNEAHNNRTDWWMANKSPEAKRKAAESRQKIRSEIDTASQLKLLDERLGVGVGAVKERARLSKLLTEKTALTIPDGTVTVEKPRKKAKRS